jgi:hypothetical protein
MTAEKLKSTIARSCTALTSCRLIMGCLPTNYSSQNGRQAYEDIGKASAYPGTAGTFRIHEERKVLTLMQLAWAAAVTNLTC